MMLPLDNKRTDPEQLVHLSKRRDVLVDGASGPKLLAFDGALVPLVPKDRGLHQDLDHGIYIICRDAQELLVRAY